MPKGLFVNCWCLRKSYVAEQVCVFPLWSLANRFKFQPIQKTLRHSNYNHHFIYSYGKILYLKPTKRVVLVAYFISIYVPSFSADLKYHAASPRTPAPCNTPSCACRAMGSTPNGKKWIDCLSPKVWHGRWCQSIFEISYCSFVEFDPFGHFGPKMFWSCVTPNRKVQGVWL